MRVRIRGLAACLTAAALAGMAGCSRSPAPSGEGARTPRERPSILLVTLDTTRADAVGPEAAGVETPAFNRLAARGLRFRQAYATAPETLPSHASMMTGLYPGGHGVHENARFLAAAHPVLAERLRQEGYRTAAFVSSYVLARRFGLARGFDTYDEETPEGGVERTSSGTADRAVAFIAQPWEGPLFLWVHFFDPHAPYLPEEPYRTRYKDRPYLGEVAAMDAQLGRLIEAFERQMAAANRPAAIVVAGDHGEALGDHGELQHGHLLYNPTMLVPLVITGPGIASGVSGTPVSIRRIFHTVLDLAGLESANSLRGAGAEVVLAEGMKPYLGYGWQPQVMAVEGSLKAILAGRLEAYDLQADPRETKNLGGGANLPSTLRRALEDYPIPSPGSASAPEHLDEDARRRLASLGYIGASTPPLVRKDAPRPADMVHLFEVIEKASGLFVQERYAEVIPLLGKIQEADPFNLDAALRLATAHSALGQNERAVAAFRRAGHIAPNSPDVRLYLALHYARGAEWERAAPMLERIVAESPERLPALEALASVRERQGRLQEAVGLRERIASLRTVTPAEAVHLGRLAMQIGRTPLAIDWFERARAAQGRAFAHDLELGVLYLDARRLGDARTALDRVPPSHPDYAMALFKRAQVSVLLKEPDAPARIQAARQHADGTTRPLIAKERLFEGPGQR